MKNKGILKKTGVLLMFCFTLFLELPSVSTKAAEENLESSYELTFTPGTGLPEELDKGNTDYAYADFELRTHSEERKNLYDIIDEVCNSFWGSASELDVAEESAALAVIEVSGLTLDEITETYYMYMNDNPVFYFLSKTIGTLETATGYEVCMYTEFLDATERSLIENTISSYIASYENVIDSSSIYNTVLAMNNALVDELTYFYEEDGVTPETDLWAHSIAGAICYGGGVCEAYARTLQMLLNYYGYDNVIVTGVASGENHIWNLVKLDDGQYYCVDVTWNDITLSNSYFACGEEMILTTHVYNAPEGSGVDFLYVLPELSEFNYLKYVSVYKDDVLLGGAGSIAGAFRYCTDTAGKYRLVLEEELIFYLPEGEWPEVTEIEFSHAFEATEEKYTTLGLCLTGDSYINSDLKFYNSNLIGYVQEEQDTIPTLHARNYTLYFTGNGNVIGHFLDEQLVGHHLLFESEPEWRCDIDGPEATIISTAKEKFEVYFSEITVGTVYLYDTWLDLRCGDFVCDNLYVAKYSEQEEEDSELYLFYGIYIYRLYNNELNVDIGTIHMEDKMCAIECSALPHNEYTLHIGNIVYENKTDEVIGEMFIFCDTNSRKKMPFWKIDNSEVKVNYWIDYYQLDGYTYDIVEEKINVCDDDQLRGYYQELKGILKYYEKFDSSSDVQDIFEFQDPLLNLGTTDLELLSLNCKVVGAENTIISFDKDFLEVDEEGNVRRKSNIVLKVTDGVLTRATAFLDGKYTLIIPVEATSISEDLKLDSNVEKVVLHSGVENIASFSFYGNNVNEFVVEENSPYYVALDGVLYTKDVDKIVAFPGGREGEFTLPDTVTEIMPYVFSNSNLKLTKLTIPSSVREIGEKEFCLNYCEEIVVDCNTVNDGTFGFNYGAQSITFGYNVMSIGSRILFDVSKIESIYVMNPYVEFAADTFAGMNSESVTIYGYTGSTAEEYVATYGAEYGLVFSAFADPMPTVTPKPEIDDVTSFVSRLYTVILDRTPDEAGLAEWVGYLQDGTFTGAEVAKGFIMSDEFLNTEMSNEEFVKILYSAFFGREADATGLTTWTDYLDAGYRKSYVFAGFANSDEFAALCEGYGVEAGSVPVTISEQQPNLSEEDYNVWLFVERLYTVVLDRTPDMSGIQEWVDYLQNGTFTGAEVAEGFIMSEEFLGKEMANEEYVRIMYKAFFGREADESGLETWMNALETEYTKEFVFAGFANSGEFGTLCEKYGITQGEIAVPEI